MLDYYNTRTQHCCDMSLSLTLTWMNWLLSLRECTCVDIYTCYNRPVSLVCIWQETRLVMDIYIHVCTRTICKETYCCVETIYFLFVQCWCSWIIVEWIIVVLFVRFAIFLSYKLVLFCLVIILYRLVLFCLVVNVV